MLAKIGDVVEAAMALSVIVVMALGIFGLL